jgi:hypothetical protein
MIFHRVMEVIAHRRNVDLGWNYFSRNEGLLNLRSLIGGTHATHVAFGKYCTAQPPED